MKIKIRKTEKKITTTIKRSELLSKLRCLGGSSWCSEENFNTNLALEKVSTAIADLLSYQNPYSFYPKPDYEVKLTKRQMDIMFVFYAYINDGKFNDAYHELWDSIEKLWETFGEDDYLAYDELVAIYGLLFTFKQAVELENVKLKLDILKYEENEEQNDFYENTIIKNLLRGTLKINELCFAERTGNRSYYIYSFRYCRDSKNEDEYKQTLELLKSDINHLPNGRLREALEQVYDSYKDNIEGNKNYFIYCDDNEKTVQIDIEKEFNQMVEYYNQSPKNTTINPFDIK